MRKTPELKLLPVVIFSGHPEPKLIEEAYRRGANSFLAKPAQFDQTVELVGSLYTAWMTAKRPTL
jgi:two-component system response regulator